MNSNKIADYLDDEGILAWTTEAYEDVVFVAKSDYSAAKAAIAELGEDCPVLFHDEAVFWDGRYRGPQTTVYAIGGDDTTGGYITVADYDSWDDTLEEALAPFVLKHPARVADALEKEGYYITGIDDRDREAYRCLADLPEFIDEKDLGEVVAWADCTSGTTDHDHLTEIVAGEYEGCYLRNYASRYQGSPDYETEIIDNLDAFLAKHPEFIR